MSVYRATYTDKNTHKTKHSKVWWYEFIFGGQRIRESAKTTRITIALEAEKNHRKRLERANAGMPTEDPGRRIKTVSEVLKTYEAEYRVNHRDNSLTIVRNRSKHVARLLGSALLPDVMPARLTEYMERRREEKASNRTINMELMVLSRAVGFTWKALWPKLRKLEENHDIGRALETEEEKRILASAAANPSKLIYPYLMVLAWTGMRADEARMLRWSQVDFEGNQVTVGKAKTTAGRGRTIPMTPVLRAAIEHHAAFYARKMGTIQPGWYVFPLSNRLALKNPSEPVSSLKTAWETVRDDAGVRCRLHDFRHLFCTKLAEAGVPESTMLDMMGHISPAMLKLYSHIRAKSRREAIAAIGAGIQYGVLQEVPKVSDSEKRTLSVTH